MRRRRAEIRNVPISWRQGFAASAASERQNVERLTVNGEDLGRHAAIQ